MIHNKIKIIIPSYNCTIKLLSVIRNLRLNNILCEIFIVDDNSSTRSKIIINNIKNKFSKVYVLNNNKNLGQGGSIKRAIQLLKNPSLLLCTVDDDGQHATTDIKKIINKGNLIYFNNRIILGSRALNYKLTPINSYIGNKLSKYIFFFITKKKIIDTQTGLRFYGSLIGNKFLKISANGFDFHNLMNFFIVKKKIKIYEEKIKTIYYNKNKDTRFN